MKKIKIKEAWKLSLGYNRELDNSYDVSPKCFCVKYDGVRITDYMTKKEAEKFHLSYALKALDGGFEIEPKEEGFIDKSLPIVSVKIVKGKYQNDVIVRNIEGQEYKIFSYYPDEITFTESELIGLTGDEAIRLYHRKDVAYLRS